MGESKTWIDANGMHVNDESLLKKMERVTASATLVEAYLNGCPAQFLFSSQLREEIFPEGPDSPLKRGDAFHKVMELYYGIDEKKRGSELNGRILNVCAKKVLSGLPDMFAKDHDFLLWLRHTMDDYIDMDEKYTNVNVAKYKEGHKYKPGLELEVSGYVGDASRRTYGKIDRLTDDGQGGVFIDDYKTGKKAKVYDPRDRFPQFDYVRQQTMYAMLLEEQAKEANSGMRINCARLLFPIPNKVVTVDVEDKTIRRKTVDDVKKASDMLNDANDANTYALSPGKLCSWCPLVNICPKADRDSRDKFVAARAQQPDAELLKPVVVKE